jgi:hypothetical protein
MALRNSGPVDQYRAPLPFRRPFGRGAKNAHYAFRKRDPPTDGLDQSKRPNTMIALGKTPEAHESCDETMGRIIFRLYKLT